MARTAPNTVNGTAVITASALVFCARDSKSNAVLWNGGAESGRVARPRLAATAFLFLRVPGGLVPAEDQGYIFLVTAMVA
jgi:hypothetical protein